MAATDLFIIGGGVNGCGIARDAAGRGLSVRLAEQGDLASGTSSVSTKLLHGGLRYLEYLEIRLVREALREREVLLRMMPHIARPMRFVLPLDPQMRFDGDTPVSRLMSRLMPWRRGHARPAAMIRGGLFLYDHLGARQILPGTTSLDLTRAPEGQPLQPRLRRAYEYSDCWVDDARLVVLNARDAAAHGADILTRARVTDARREDHGWTIRLADGRSFRARILVNAAGPWVGEVIRDVAHLPAQDRLRLVRGSHIVTRRLFDHDKAYMFQGPDGRIVFAIPYEGDFTLIGTTDMDHHGPPGEVHCTPEEEAYLCACASRFLRQPVTPADVVWRFAGVRPLHDEGEDSATAATRDYTLSLDDGGPPCLHVFGGKITTYRRLAEAALAKLSDHLPGATGPWTAGAALPGGDFAVDGLPDLVRGLCADYPFLSPDWALRLARAYGSKARTMLGTARSMADLGRGFGATLTAAELDWMMTQEWAQTAEDAVWRRSKLGLRLAPEQIAAIDAYMARARAAA